MNAHPSETSDDTIIGNVEKNRRERVQVALRKWQHYRLIDIRQCFLPNEGAEYHPTGKRVSLRADRIDQLIELLLDARAEAVRVGWIESTP